jgi:hypothetical protein
MEVDLLTSSVPRALEMRTKLFGFELADLLLIFLNLALTNLVFGSSEFRYSLVWGSSLSIAGFLFFVKRGKPDRYLEHAFKYMVSPSVFFANLPDPKSLKAGRFHAKFARR